MNENGTYQWSPNGGSKKIDLKKLPKIALIAAIALVLIIGATTCFYTVDEKQVALVKYGNRTPHVSHQRN